MKTWKKVSTKIVHKNPWYSVTADKVIKPDGSHGTFFVVRKTPGLVIIPFNGDKIFLVRQYRYTTQKTHWELPAGKSESTNYLSEAKRELKEETGFVAKQWIYLGYFEYEPGLSDQIAKVFLAKKLIKGDH